MAQYPEVFVLRHGQTDWNVSGRFQGVMNSGLTKTGQQQARDQGEILRGLGAGRLPQTVYCSPLGRTRETLALALDGLDMPVRFDDRLKEVDFGSWEGLLLEEIAQGWPEADVGNAAGDWYFNSPDGESFDPMRARVGAFLDELQAPAIFVTHGITSLILRGIWRGLTKAQMLVQNRDQGCVYHLKDGAEHCLWPARPV